MYQTRSNCKQNNIEIFHHTKYPRNSRRNVINQRNETETKPDTISNLFFFVLCSVNSHSRQYVCIWTLSLTGNVYSGKSDKARQGSKQNYDHSYIEFCVATVATSKTVAIATATRTTIPNVFSTIAIRYK